MTEDEANTMSEPSPECAPPPSSETVGEEEITKAIYDADRAFGYSMELTRLIGGVSTYTLTFEPEVGEPPSEWSDRVDLYEHVEKVRARHRARAVLAALRQPTRSRGA